MTLNEDLIRAYRLCLGKVDVISMPEIYEMISREPASRFWVSEQRAAIVLSHMLGGGSISNMRPAKQEMFRELFERFCRLRQKHPDWTIITLAAHVVNQPAPRFYFSPSTIGEYIRQIKKTWKR